MSTGSTVLGEGFTTVADIAVVAEVAAHKIGFVLCYSRHGLMPQFEDALTLIEFELHEV